MQILGLGGIHGISMRGPCFHAALSQHPPSGTTLIIGLWESELVDGFLEDGHNTLIEVAIVYRGERLDVFCVELA